MPRTGTTPQRGYDHRGSDHNGRYGWPHRNERAARLKALRRRPGSMTCPRCSQPVYPSEELHLDHAEDGGYLPGLAHATCNTAAGGAKGNAARTGRTDRHSREW